jgi:hypothetical protein
MKRLFESKPFILIVGGISILALVYLAASLSGLEFKPGTPFVYRSEYKSGASGPDIFLNPFVYVAVLFIIGLLVMFFILPPDQRKKTLLGLVRLVLLGSVLYLIVSRISLGEIVPKQSELVGNPVVTAIADSPSTPAPEMIPSVFVLPQVSSWISTILTLVFLLIVAGVWARWFWRKRETGPPLDELGNIARETLDNLDAGKDWGDTVLNCYYRMTKTVETWRHIQRQASMTPAEFAGFLVSAGLPRQVVFNLTDIFERVRYGGKKSTSQDISQAMDCLMAIMDYCKEA